LSSGNGGRIIYDISPFTHLDYPGKLAAIAWFAGCNMRCMYCYNSDIVFASEGRYTLEELLAFLQRRVGLLDGVVLSGGEPTLRDLIPVCREIKALGFDVKLDTNGLKPERIRELVEEGLVDYIALDYKAESAKFGYITGSSQYLRFSQTLDYLIGIGFDFEVRTTVHADLLTPDDINAMMRRLKERGYRGTYYLQNFVETPQNIANLTKPSRDFDRSGLEEILPVEWR
jgi:pyruvate formate lyase activating enzyme